MRIAIATCVRLPEPDPDQQPLLDALRAAGMHAELLPWDAAEPATSHDDPAGSTSADRFDLCVLRSTWNYPERPDAFRRWVDRVASITPVLNAPPIVHWNLHKGYLAAFERAGVAIVPTTWIARGEVTDLAALLADRGWDDCVIKPAVSAGSYHTRRFSIREFDAASAFLAASAAARDTMVQRYLPSVEQTGERALIWIDGAFTHAIRKEPRFADGDERVSPAIELTPEEQAFGQRVLDATPPVPGGRTAESSADPLYARVDAMRLPDGRLCLSELELIEPSLFLIQHPPAMERLVSAIRRRTEALRGR